MNWLEQKLSDITLIAFDTETTGAYPLGDEVVEFGAVKWRGGQIIDELQVLVKPSQPMTPFNMSIHGITNEMVENCPPMSTQIQKIRDFMSDGVLVAHHAPFDIGFMTVEFEKAGLPFPNDPVLCSSLLARRLIEESPNHKLQTLIKVLKIDGGTAHRALDDARACLYVELECWKRAGEDKTLAEISKLQGKELKWADYVLLKNPSNLIQALALAILHKKDFDIVYDGGSLKGKTRRITPQGIVRNPDGDYVSAICHIDRAQKRFYLGKILDFSS
ncbi:MAG: exonuclease [Bdellovibrionaceae bacterium]|nr:exonuclease [Pseudobdellovibrionaceae bacterium]